MAGRREPDGPSSRARMSAGVAALALTGTALALALLPAGTAQAKTPSANYHAGSDKAVFTVTGVEDSNCLISTGGDTVFIKPGDRIDFSSGLAGVSLNGLDLQGGQIAGLDVHAKIDGGSRKGGETLAVPAGKTVKLKGLAAGTHKLAWSANSVSVAVPALTKTITGLLGAITHKTIPAHNITIPLSSSQLKSGASLSWTGKIHVTTSAAQCTVSVQTPNTKVSAGPVHVTVPGQKVTVPGVTVPTKVTGVPSLTPPTGSTKPTGGSRGTKASTPPASYAPPIESVPEMVVPRGSGAGVYGGGGGYDLGLGTDNGHHTKLSTGGSQTSTKSPGSDTTTKSSSSNGPGAKTKTVDLASNNSDQSVSAQLPVLLAILAVIALAIVAGTYARLFLLGRNK